MLPEDGNPQFTLEEASPSAQNKMNKKDGNDRTLRPLNQYITGTESSSQNVTVLQSAYLQRLN